MRTNLLKILCKKSAISYIIFDSGFQVIESNIEIQTESDVRDYLWEIIGLEEPILALQKHNTPIEIPMIQRERKYYDLEIDTFKDENKQSYFIAYMQKKSQYTNEYANVLKEINKKTLIYDLSDEKKESAYYKEINKHLISFHVDLDGFITMVNDACLHFFNKERTEFLEKHFSEFFQVQKRQKDTTSTIFLAKNSLGDDIFFHADILPLKDKDGQIIENIIITQDITYLKKIKKELEYAQEHDALTGLPNRHTFLKKIDLLIKEKKNFSLCFIDIDNFRTLNEEYGSHAGDMLLKHLTTLFLEFLDPQDSLIRIQGDLFGIIFEIAKEKSYIQSLLKGLEDLAEKNPLYYNSEDIIQFHYTTLLLHYPQDAKSAKEFLSTASKLLKKKKIDLKSKALS